MGRGGETEKRETDTPNPRQTLGSKPKAHIRIRDQAPDSYPLGSSRVSGSVLGQPAAPTLLRPWPKPLQELDGQEWCQCPEDGPVLFPHWLLPCFPQLLGTGGLEPEGPGRRYGEGWLPALEGRAQGQRSPKCPSQHCHTWASASLTARAGLSLLLDSRPIPPTTRLCSARPHQWGEASEVPLKCRHLPSSQTPQTVNEFPQDGRFAQEGAHPGLLPSMGRQVLGQARKEGADVDPSSSAIQAPGLEPDDGFKGVGELRK